MKATAKTNVKSNVNPMNPPKQQIQRAIKKNHSNPWESCQNPLPQTIVESAQISQDLDARQFIERKPVRTPVLKYKLCFVCAVTLPKMASHEETSRNRATSVILAAGLHLCTTLETLAPNQSRLYLSSVYGQEAGLSVGLHHISLLQWLQSTLPSENDAVGAADSSIRDGAIREFAHAWREGRSWDSRGDSASRMCKRIQRHATVGDATRNEMCGCEISHATDCLLQQLLWLSIYFRFRGYRLHTFTDLIDLIRIFHITTQFRRWGTSPAIAESRTVLSLTI